MCSSITFTDFSVSPHFIEDLSDQTAEVIRIFVDLLSATLLDPLQAKWRNRIDNNFHITIKLVDIEVLAVIRSQYGLC